jgi:hypothetical protein
VHDANDVVGQSIADGGQCGGQPCVATATGLPFDCSQIFNSSGAGAGILVSAFPQLDAPLAHDTANTVFIVDVSAPTFTPTLTATPEPPATPTPTPSATSMPSGTPSEIVTASPTPSASPTATADPTATDTPATAPTHTVQPNGTPAPICIGDCDGSGGVTIDELVKGVSIALGTTPLSDCPAFDADGSQSVTIDELLRGVGNALNGCAS